MGDRRLVADFFGEDAGHELFFRSLLPCLAASLHTPCPEIHTVSARGGKGRAIAELKLWLKAGQRERGDLLAILIDANAVGWHQQRRDIEAAVAAGPYPWTVIGCPDPYVEAWLLADPSAFTRGLGMPLRAALTDTGIDPKLRLQLALEEARIPILGDLMSVALDVIPEMNLFAAGRSNPSLKSFVDDLRSALKRFSAA